VTKDDFVDFSAMLDAVLSMWGDKLEPTAKAFWFRSLQDYTIDEVRAGLDGHVRCPQNGKFSPKPAHIIEKILAKRAEDGRPGPEEAWSIALRSVDEAETVVWTTECMTAWSAARTVQQTGDEVGARMAFREVYVREVDAARRAGIPVEWHTSLGFDVDRRKAVIQTAIDAGRLPMSHAYEALPAPTSSPLLLEMSGQEQKTIPDHIRQKIRELRLAFSREYTGPTEADLERERTAELKRIADENVRSYMLAR
jgi:hypothetical protein